MTDEAFDLDEMKEIIDEFLIEADEIITKLDGDMVKLEQNSDDTDLLNEIFRSAHTIKGTSGFLGFDKVTSLTHKMEDVLNKLRKGELKVTSEIIDTLLQAIDNLKVLIDDIKAGSDSNVDIEQVKSQLIAIMNGESTTQPDKTAKKTSGKKKSPAKAKKKVDEVEEEEKISEKSSTPQPNEVAGTIDTDTREQPAVTPDEPVQIADETVEPAAVSDLKPETIKAKLKQNTGLHKAVDQTIRVGVDRLDNLMNIMGELVLSRNSVVQLGGRMNAKYEGDELVDDLNRTSTQINFITTELQTAVMKMRMLPIGKVFNKFPRMVRDLARSRQKEIELVIIGEETELDRSVIEEIGDPLVHLVRNAADHGIEPPDDREKAGKNRLGQIKLIASQEGSNIVVRIIDDGAGLDIKRIRDKAVERGLATSEGIKVMSDKEVYNFIFHPGFSTAQKVTDVSGRGVGMDVVRTNIEKLKGLIELDSEPGKGTSIIIKLPLTLAIVQGLQVEASNELFILPLASVLEMVKISRQDIYSINKKEVIRLRDEVLPILNLHSLYFKGSGKLEVESIEQSYVVVLGLAEKRLGLVVDRLLGQEEVVIKSLGDFLGGTPGIAGATILGDGRVRLIIDPAGAFNLAN